MISIIPKPNSITDLNEVISISTFSMVGFNGYEKATKRFLALFGSFLDDEALYKISLKIEPSKNNKAYLKNLESYSLEITKDETIIKTTSEIGAYYALVSLNQIIKKEDNNLKLNLCIINDAPHFKFRSFSLDECRHFFGKEEVKKIIDELSNLKINYLHWHLSDDQGFRVNFKKFPLLKKIGSVRKGTKINNVSGPDYELKEYGYSYSEEDILEVIEYAKERFVSIIPEFDMPGHTKSIIASYPHLHCENKQVEVFDGICGNYDILCVGKDSTYEFLKDFWFEVLRLFKDSKYIHIGGDEVITTNWENCSDCNRVLKEMGYQNHHELQGYFSNKLINEVLNESNKNIIMWHDGITDYTNKDVILQYWVWQMDQDGIRKINEGRPTIYSPCSQCYFDAPYAELPLSRTYNRGIKLDGLTKKGLASIFGMESCMWTEFIRENRLLEYMIFPRLHAFSESAWTHKKNRNYEDFLTRLDYHYKLLDEKNICYASKEIIDRLDKDEEISKIFRNTDRYIEMKLDNKE